MKQSTKDMWAVVFGVLIIAFVVVMAVIGLTGKLWLPCEWYNEYFSIAQVPMRCLKEVLP
jgi:hypothetical protein